MFDEAEAILLVDDSPDEAELTRLALEGDGLADRVLWLKDGVEALDFMFGEGAYASRDTRWQPSVILLDLRMPKVDGLEVLSRLKADTRTRAVPVVMWTSSCQESDVAECYLRGANSYIVKSTNFAECFEGIRQVCAYWSRLNRRAAYR